MIGQAPAYLRQFHPASVETFFVPTLFGGVPLNDPSMLYNRDWKGQIQQAHLLQSNFDFGTHAKNTRS